VLRPGVAIDNVTGTAADRLLRAEERAIRGLRLSSQVTIALPPSVGEELPRPAELLLRAGARLIGGSAVNGTAGVDGSRSCCLVLGWTRPSRRPTRW